MDATVVPFLPLTHKLYTEDKNLKHRDFIGALYKTATQKCKELLPGVTKNNIKSCQRELMIASSCIIFNKSNVSSGDLMDHIGDCKFELELVKNSLDKSYEDFPHDKAQDWYLQLSRSIKNFI